MIQVNYLDQSGESCWVDFEDSASATEWVKECADCVEVLTFEEYEADEYEDDGQPSEYDEWQDYYGGDDYCYGTYGDY